MIKSLLIFTRLLGVLMLTGCVSRQMLTTPTSNNSPQSFSPKSELGVPCVITISAPENFPGRYKGIVENPFLSKIFYYPLKSVLQTHFENELYRLFAPPQGNIMDAFTVEISPSESSLYITSGGAEYSLCCQMTLRAPNDKVILSKTLSTFEKSSFNGRTTPNAVSRAAEKISRDCFQSLKNEKRLMAYSVEQQAHPAAMRTTAISADDLESKIALEKATGHWLAADKTRVLSIGVSHYSDESIPTVKYAEKDAASVYSFSRAAGIPQENITLLTNEKATRNLIVEELYRLKKMTTEPDEKVILYFSGHGAPVVHSGRVTDSVLVPHDARESAMAATGLSVNELNRIIADSPGQWIVVLDSCFSGKKGRGLFASGVKGMAVVSDHPVCPAGKQRWWITATSGTHFANDHDKAEQGLFTYYFLESLNNTAVDINNDGIISLKESFDWTQKQVHRISTKSYGQPQLPEFSGTEDMPLLAL